MTTALADPRFALPLIDWRKPHYDPIFQVRLERLKNIRESPDDLIPGLKEFYKNNPIAFVTDWGCTYDPRNVEIGLPAVVPFVLFPRQQEFLLWLLKKWQSREDGLVEKSRDMGVSWLCIAFAVWMWLFHAGVVVGFGSRKEVYVDDLNDPKSLFWKARKFVEYLPAEFRPTGWNEKTHAQYMNLTNPDNESVIMGEAGDNIGRGARASLYFVDEAAFVEHQETVDAALSQTTNCKIDVSTPNGSGNAFYRKRHGGKVDVFIFDWREDPRKDEAWYQKQVNKLDAVIVAAEIDRNYESSVVNAFIPGDRVLMAMQRGPADVHAVGGLRVGIDVARFGDDKTVILFRRGRVVLKFVQLAKLDVAQVASSAHVEIMAFKEKPEQIAVDVINMGAGVADLLRAWYPDKIDPRTGKKTKTVVDVNSALRMSDGQHYNLRAFMWAEMREWLKTGSLPNDQDLKTQLTSLQYGFKGGELLLESKDDAKNRGVKSPDIADALAFTFAEPTIPQQERPKVPLSRPHDLGMGLLG